MNIKFLILFLTIFVLKSCATSASKTNAPLHNVIECKIVDMKGKVLRNYGTSRCLFLQDGSVVAGSFNRLVFYNPDMTIKWHKEINTHHQLNFGLDEKHILVMSSSVHKIKKILTRFDTFIIYDVDGNIIKQLDFYDHKDELTKKTSKSKINVFKINESLKKHVPGAEMEFSHANSFYEIDENQLSKANPIFKKGNYIINANLLELIIVMDSDLKKILWSTPQHAPAGLIPNWHDVYVTKSGSLLMFNNNAYLSDNNPGSTIDETNPLTLETKTLFKASTPVPFYSEYSGGIQILPNGNYLMNTVTPYGTGIEVDGQTNKIIWSLDNPDLDPKNGLPLPFQQIRRLDLSEFLEKNKGL